MIQPIPCSNCKGVGCRACNNVGFFGRDEHYDYYLEKDNTGNIKVAGIKQGGGGGGIFKKIFSFFWRLVAKQLEEPYDFIWAVKKRKKS